MFFSAQWTYTHNIIRLTCDDLLRTMDLYTQHHQAYMWWSSPHNGLIHTTSSGLHVMIFSAQWTYTHNIIRLTCDDLLRTMDLYTQHHQAYMWWSSPHNGLIHTTSSGLHVMIFSAQWTYTHKQQQVYIWWGERWQTQSNCCSVLYVMG